MLPNRVLKYILDIESIISEIEEIKLSVNNNFEKFKNDMKSTRAVERQLEIIGEAANKLSQIDPSIKISGIKGIISLRNYLAHSYDTVEHQILWGIIQKDLPILSKELKDLRS